MKSCHFSRQLEGKHVNPKEGLYFQALASVTCENGACILCIGSSDGCVHMYSPEDDMHFIEVRSVTCAASIARRSCLLLIEHLQ
jgi:hypothetical protein